MHRGRRNVLSITMTDRKRGHGLNCSKRGLGCCTVICCYADKSSIKEGETPKLVPQKTRGSVKRNTNEIPSSTAVFLCEPQVLALSLIAQVMENFRFLMPYISIRKCFFLININLKEMPVFNLFREEKTPFSKTRQKLPVPPKKMEISLLGQNLKFSCFPS